MAARLSVLHVTLPNFASDASGSSDALGPQKCWWQFPLSYLFNLRRPESVPTLLLGPFSQLVFSIEVNDVEPFPQVEFQSNMKFPQLLVLPLRYTIQNIVLVSVTILNRNPDSFASDSEQLFVFDNEESFCKCIQIESLQLLLNANLADEIPGTKTKSRNSSRTQSQSRTCGSSVILTLEATGSNSMTLGKRIHVSYDPFLFIQTWPHPLIWKLLSWYTTLTTNSPAVPTPPQFYACRSTLTTIHDHIHIALLYHYIWSSIEHRVKVSDCFDLASQKVAGVHRSCEMCESDRWSTWTRDFGVSWGYFGFASLHESFWTSWRQSIATLMVDKYSSRRFRGPLFLSYSRGTQSQRIYLYCIHRFIVWHRLFFDWRSERQYTWFSF